ncbi:uncharacterized protein LOC109402673 [Aedes albopictus]|uniref:Uncharacterized protein n=1 Tax=Aedes albopictus TaxID=7160 RepID=A0ABM1YJ85_AEDAL|nr:uncharacterized protein LOC115256377 [Aedes albopictus]
MCCWFIIKKKIKGQKVVRDGEHTDGRQRMRQKNRTNNTLPRQRPAARSGDNTRQQPSTSKKTNTNNGRSHINTGTVKNYGTSRGGNNLAIQEHSSAAKNVYPEKESQQPSTSQKTNTNNGRSHVNTGTVSNYETPQLRNRKAANNFYSSFVDECNEGDGTSRAVQMTVYGSYRCDESLDLLWSDESSTEVISHNEGSSDDDEYDYSDGGTQEAAEFASSSSHHNPSQYLSNSEQNYVSYEERYVNAVPVNNYRTSHEGSNLAIQEYSSAVNNVYPETERTVEMYYGNYTSDGYSAEALVYCEYSDDEEHSGDGIQIMGVYASYSSDDEYDENSGMINFIYDSDDD